MSLNNRKITPFFKKNDCTPSTKAILEDPWKPAWVSQAKPVKRFQNDRRQSWGVGFFFPRVSHRRLLLNNAQHTMSLAIVNSHEDRDPTPPTPQTNHTTSSYPSLLHITHDISSDGAVVGQRDRNVGWPHGQHYSAGEEEAVSTRLTFPPTIWQQVRKVSLLIVGCRRGQVYEFTFCFIQGFWCRPDDVTLIDCSPACL